MTLFNDRRAGLMQVNEGGSYPEGTQIKAKGLRGGWRGLNGGTVNRGQVNVGPTFFRNGKQVATSDITATRQGKPYKPPRYASDDSIWDYLGP